MSNSSPVSKLIDFRGMEAAVRTLPTLWHSESGVHAVILYGPMGSGKSTLAGLLTRAWLCQQPTEIGPCEACAACRASAAGQSADVLEIGPLGKSRWILVGQITPTAVKNEDIAHPPLIEFFRTAPLAARMKVAIIESAERLREEATNSLLKTLEEPPSYGRIILVTESRAMLAPTLVSRSVLIATTGPSDLSERDLSVGEAMRKALHADLLGQISDLARTALDRNPAQALVLAERFRQLAAEDADEDRGVREKQSALLEALADAFLAMGVSDFALKTIEVHRRVMGNAHFGLAVDGLFTGFST